MRNAAIYYDDIQKDATFIDECFPFEKFIPWYRYYWNPYWIHRLAIDLCCRIDSTNKYSNMQKISYYFDIQRNILRLSDTFFESNKKITHYLTLTTTACLLDASYKYEYFNKLEKSFIKIANDGCWREGTHYAISILNEINKVWYILLTRISDFEESEFYKSYNKVCQWLQYVANYNGVVTPIGDGWPENIKHVLNMQSQNDQFCTYDDMDILFYGQWKIIRHHRRSGFAFHEHPELDGLHICYNDQWAMEGVGMPSYTDKLLNPFRWYRPRNHWITESKFFDLPFLWRLRKTHGNRRLIEYNKENDIIIIKENYYNENQQKTIRFPIDDSCIQRIINEELVWFYNGFQFRCSGQTISKIRFDKSYITTGWKRYKTIRVIRIKGKQLYTEISKSEG